MVWCGVCVCPCLQKVDVVGLQPLQTLLNAVRDVSATEAHSVGVAGVHLEPDFGGHDEPIPFLSVKGEEAIGTITFWDDTRL